MNSQESKNPQKFRRSSGNNMLLGLFVVVGGFLLLLHQLDFVLLPHWLFSWPMFLVAFGLLIGAKHRFAGAGWLVMVLVGTFFLLDSMTSYHWQLHRFGWPIAIIILGMFLLFKAVMKPSHGDYDRRGRHSRRWGYDTNPTSGGDSTDEKKNDMSGFGEDFIDVTNVFGGTKKRIFSKNFYGGDITNFFGGTDLDLTQADITKEGIATVDITQIFGGVKLIVPANWTIKSEMTTVLGGFDDKRMNITQPTEKKVLVLTGTCIFGGVEIKSY
ncbi:MAG TPA: LiaF domain-containing protein [Cyclobacteriaceae bacterium]|nr:LiaF domain-containing protein [Cyclobacteriaceae bacterium]